MKLSLCIATFNEEKNLHYPMDSTIDIVDEVIIVDGGSKDRTVEIAKSYGKKVKVFAEKFEPMFHKNKQKAIEAAKGEWILQLDADEEITEELKEEIKNVISVGNDQRIVPNMNESVEHDGSTLQYVAYNIPRKNFFLTRFLMKGGQYPDYTIRLYKNGVAKFPCKDVHENVEIISQKAKVKSQNYNSKVKSEENVIASTLMSLRAERSNLSVNSAKQSQIGYLKNPILHYADPDFSRYLMRWDRYTTLEVERMSKDVKLNFFNYFFWKPKVTFFMMYFRHKGFLDGFPGFVFALFSSIRFWVIYIKWRIRH